MRKPVKRTDGAEKPLKFPKGFYCLLDRREGVHRTKGYSTFAEALYNVRRYWSNQLGTNGVSILINDKKLYNIDTATRKEEFYMGILANHQASKGGGNGGRHWATEDEKKTLVTLEVPFFLRSHKFSESDKFTQKDADGEEHPSRYIEYNVDLDVTSDDYKLAERKKQLPYVEITIKLPRDASREDDLDVMLDNGYESEDGTNLPLVLVSFPPKKGKYPYYKITDKPEVE